MSLNVLSTTRARLSKNHFKLSIFDEIAVDKYTSCSSGINDRIRLRKRKDRKDKQIIACLYNMLKKHRMPRDIVVHCGLKFSPYTLLRHRNDTRTLRARGFMSTSLSYDVAQGFGRESDDALFFDGAALSDADKLSLKGSNMYYWDPDKKLLAFYKKKGFANPSAMNAPRIRRYKHVMSVVIPRRSAAVYVAHGSNHSHEQEVIIRHGARFALDADPVFDHSNEVIRWTGRLSHDGLKTVGGRA